ncbi:hypothetical protein Tco_1309329, partial [Tanacetum coccineum]
MSFSKRSGTDAACYSKPLDSLKKWNDHFFWVDTFACPASFSWNTSKSVSKDPFPKSFEFNTKHYATLVAYPVPFHNFCVKMARMDLLSFIRIADPTKVRVGERQRAKDEPKLLDTTVGRVVLLLTVAPTHGQGNSASGNQGAGIQYVSEVAEVVAEDVAPLQPRHKKKRKTVVVDVGEPSHPAKKLRDDHGTPGGPTIGEREEGDHTKSFAGTNLRTIRAPQRFIISLDSSHHSGVNIAKAEVDSFARTFVPLMTMTTTITSTVDPTTTVKEKLVESSVFGGGSSSGADHTVGGFSGLTGSDFIVGGIRTVVSPDTNLQKVYVPQWSVTNGSRLDDGRTCREMVDEFAPSKFFASIRGMEHD